MVDLIKLTNLLDEAKCYAIPLQELTCSGKFLCGLEGGGEIDVAEADSGPHGFEAFAGEPIETTVLDPCDKVPVHLPSH
jgi:hypothetical protein